MPIYEYVCSNCKHEFEELQKFSDPPVTDCPSCHRKGRVARMLSQSAFMLRGSGWYSDGYSSAAKSGNGGGESKGDSKGASKDGGGSKDGGSSKDGGGSSASEGSGSSGSGKSESKSTGSSTS